MTIKQLDLQSISNIGTKTFKFDKGVNYIISDKRNALESFYKCLAFLFGGNTVRESRLSQNGMACESLYVLSEHTDGGYNFKKCEKAGFDNNWLDYSFTISMVIDNFIHSAKTSGNSESGETIVELEYNDSYKHYTDHENITLRLNSKEISQRRFDYELGRNGMNYSYQFPLQWDEEKKLDRVIDSYFDITPDFAVLPLYLLDYRTVRNQLPKIDNGLSLSMQIIAIVPSDWNVGQDQNTIRI